MFVIPGSSRGRKECGSRPGRRGGGTRARRLASNLARGQGSRRDSRAAVRRQRHPAQGSGVARVAREAGLPPSAVEGIRLALDPGAGRNAVPVRSAILGAAMAMIVMLATATFGSSLATLVSHPALYGWNWTYALASGTPTYIPRARAAALLDHDPAVAARTGVYYGTFKIDGLTVPVIGQSPRAPVAPPVLSGHGLRAAGQIVLGPATLAALHKHVGDEVTVQSGAVRRTRHAHRRHRHAAVARHL
jgi:hypothetical protein